MVVVVGCFWGEKNQKFCFLYTNLEFSVDFQVGNETPACRAHLESRVVKLDACSVRLELEAVGRCGRRALSGALRAARCRTGPLEHADVWRPGTEGAHAP